MIRFLLSLTLAALSASDMAADSPKGPIVRASAQRFEVGGLSQSDLDWLKKLDSKSERWQELFTVHVISDRNEKTRDQPAMLGSYRVEDGVVCFEPRFPLVHGVWYRAVFRPARLPGHKEAEDVQAEFELPKRKPSEPTSVAHVYPSRNVLPENQLKFYLHFSAPMSRGEAYRNVHLLDEAGKAVAFPFLELDEELWDPAGKRFTLFFDPGRIKRGLKPREEAGPALIEGKRYTLVIDAKWEDAQGNPLKAGYRKQFRVVAPNDTVPNPKVWKLTTPAAGKVEPLRVSFPKPLDHALLGRLLWVIDEQGKRLPGTITVTDEETRWSFTPEQAWRAGRYELVIDTSLEDLAGNNLNGPFEVDLFRPIRRELKIATVKRSFVVD